VLAPRRQGLPAGEPPSDGGLYQAEIFIADVVGNLARLARHHKQKQPNYLLAIAKLEAKEHVGLRSRRKLSLAIRSLREMRRPVARVSSVTLLRRAWRLEPLLQLQRHLLGGEIFDT
jgi:hypothetical protein